MTATSTLEKRIASALTADTTSNDLVLLIEETVRTITEADQIATREKERALDPALSPDPKAAREAMQAAEFAAARLITVLPRLQMKKEEVEGGEYLAQWKEAYTAVKNERDTLAGELREFYPAWASKVADLFTRITANDAELSRLHQARPSGVGLHLASAELVARGLESFSIASPCIVEQLKLPDFEHSGQMLWPKLAPLNPVLIAPLVGGDPREYSGDWWKVKEEEAHAVQDRQEREAAEKEAEARANWRGPRWWEGERA